jgi:predicted amidohydrolase YtcJ
MAASAARIFTGGTVRTMDDSVPDPEAVAVGADGRILLVGTVSEVEALADDSTERTDLQGRTLMPGFVDGHCHLLGFGSQAVGANLLAGPDGVVESIDDLVEQLRLFAAGPDVGRTGWIFGIGYDDSLLGRHPTRDDLDLVSTEVPVMAVHISGHFSAVNSVGLAKAGYTAETPDPEGGVIRRREGSQEPNGVLEELASFPVMFPALSPSAPEDVEHFARRGLELAKSYGYTTVQEGRAMGDQHESMVGLAERGVFDIDVVSYIDYTAKDVLDGEWASRSYRNRYRAGGLKITLDGSPQGRTAWRTEPYLLPPDGQEPGYAGYPAIPDTAEVSELFAEAYDKGWQTLCHVNGDAAADQMFEAMRPHAERTGRTDLRHVLIHGQLIRIDQLDTCAELGVIPSLFPMHTFYWGDWYDEIIGPDAAQRISPTRSALDRVPVITSHTDAPGGAAQPHAGRVGHRQPRLAQRQGHGRRRAADGGRGDAGHHVVERLPARRGGLEGLDHGRQARRSRDPERGPVRHRPHAAEPDHGRGDHQGGPHGLAVGRLTTQDHHRQPVRPRAPPQPPPCGQRRVASQTCRVRSPCRSRRCRRTPGLLTDRVGSVAHRLERTATFPSGRHSPPTRTATLIDRPAGSRCTTSEARTPGFTRATGAFDAFLVTGAATRTVVPVVPRHHVTPEPNRTAGLGGCATEM